MLVIDDHNVLAFETTHPEDILATIPKAKLVDVAGHEFMTVPHHLDAVRVLRNLGFDAPSPILSHYNWPGRWTPFDHQTKTSAFLTLNQRALVLNEIGTGKSLSALWAADYLMNLGLIKRVLVVSPLSTLERVWADELYKNLIHRSFAVLHGTRAKRLKLMARGDDFCIINHDGFGIIAQEALDEFDLVIVDEAAVLRNPSTKRFKRMLKFVTAQPDMRLWLMTGTPTPNEPTDAWALARLIGNPDVPKYYTHFKDKVMMKVSQWKWEIRANAAQEVERILHPSIRFSRDECLDLPDTITQTHAVEMTKEQKHLFNEMKKELLAELGAKTITAANEAIKLQKLLQICLGVAYDQHGQNVPIDATPRVNLTCDIIEQAGEKVIVFVPFTGALNMVAKAVAKRWTCAVVDGNVTPAKRAAIFHAFQNDPDPHVLVAHPGTMAHGLTLTEASTIIWYGPTNSNETYVQANGRIERIGKRNISNVVHIEASAVERTVFARLAGKQKLQGILLDLLTKDDE